MKAAEIRELSEKEIVEKLQAEVDNYSRMKLNHVITPLENPNKIKEARKTIARINTIIKERELN
ncbi:MAG: 50S ribosomal protein L29 [Bacteroidales bacterium]|jgi:large subunit ribosomal protein L29|nr:50S ribosomal protein L29 [Bacteroidales bacterium]